MQHEEFVAENKKFKKMKPSCIRRTAHPKKSDVIIHMESRLRRFVRFSDGDKLETVYTIPSWKKTMKRSYRNLFLASFGFEEGKSKNKNADEGDDTTSVSDDDSVADDNDVDDDDSVADSDCSSSCCSSSCCSSDDDDIDEMSHDNKEGQSDATKTAAAAGISRLIRTNSFSVAKRTLMSSSRIRDELDDVSHQRRR